MENKLRIACHIAEEAGFEAPNIVTLIKQGKAKLPMDRVGTMTRALEADPVELRHICLEEYQPATWRAVKPAWSRILRQRSALDRFLPRPVYHAPLWPLSRYRYSFGATSASLQHDDALCFATSSWRLAHWGA